MSQEGRDWLLWFPTQAFVRRRVLRHGRVMRTLAAKRLQDGCFKLFVGDAWPRTLPRCQKFAKILDCGLPFR
jgi:hypothetical protein